MSRLFKIGEYPFQPIKRPLSPLGQWYNHWLKVGKAWTDHNEANKRLFNDLIDLWTAAITPTSVTFLSKGFCEPLPFIEDIVDFRKLNKEGKDFYLNFFTPRDLIGLNHPQESEGPHSIPKTWAAPFSQKTGMPLPDPKTVEKGRSGTGVAMHVFKGMDIRPEHVRAAFAFPLVYEPVRIPPNSGELAFEGANWEPITFGNLLGEEKRVVNPFEIKTVVLVDIVSMLEPFLLREPRNLWDAFGLLIMFPVVAHARRELARFESKIDKNGVHTDYGFKFKKVKFQIDDNEAENILDWSHSNMSRMFDIGHEAGEAFCAENWDDL
jgi:hypothetical protein